jgi:ubiquinone/menaquinone biosynthesis C-methylase UbiE
MDNYNDIIVEQEKYYDVLAPLYEKRVDSFIRSEVPIEIQKKWEYDCKMVSQGIASIVTDAICVADIGCGPSRIPLDCVAQRIFFFDTSMNMLAQARLRHRGAGRYFIRARAQDLPLNNGKLNVVICIQLLSHLPDIECRKAINELCRIIKPNGKLFISDSMAPFPGKATTVGVIQYRTIKNRGSYRVYKHYRNPQDLARMLPNGIITFEYGKRFLFNLIWKKLDQNNERPI